MVLHACNPSTVVQKAGISGVQSHPELYSNFEASLDYMRLSLKKKKEKRRSKQGIKVVVFAFVLC